MYTLTKIEEKELDRVWNFLHYFNKNLPDNYEYIEGSMSWVSSYRNYIINTIRRKYTYQDFYKYEKIINKLFWNLKKKLKPFIKENKTKYKIKKNFNKKLISRHTEINNKYYGSTINSYIQFNYNNKKWYILEEVSKLDKICMNIMRNRKDYENYFNNPDKIKKYKNIIEFYYFMNYPFPNINPMFYNENKKSFWIKKIKKMYYTNSKNEYYKYDKYWYILIEP